MSDTKRVLLGGTAAIVVLLVAVLSVYGTGETGVEQLVLWTARLSLVFFAAAFAGTFSPAESWLARRRYGFILALVLSHALHAVAIVALAVLTDGENLEARGAVVIAGGGLGYAAIGVAALRPESRLAEWGMHWLWFVFFAAYVPRALQSPLLFGPAIVLLVVVLWVRISSALKHRRQNG